VVGGPDDDNLKFYILKSADNGATWSISYDIPATDPNFYFDAEIRADGDHITMCACGMSTDAGYLLGFVESTDGGATWHLVSITPETVVQILVPA
jgi:hypothetical protein